MVWEKYISCLKGLIGGRKKKSPRLKGKKSNGKEISRLEGKLSNQGFPWVKAPEAVVAKEKEKLEEYKQNNMSLLEREAFFETL